MNRHGLGIKLLLGQAGGYPSDQWTGLYVINLGHHTRIEF